MAVPHEGLTSRGTVYSNCSLWVYRFSLVGPSLSWGELGTMSLFRAASKMPCASFSLYSIILYPCASCPAYCITSVWVQGTCERAAMRLWVRTPAWCDLCTGAGSTGQASQGLLCHHASSDLHLLFWFLESLSAAQAGIPNGLLWAKRRDTPHLEPPSLAV